MTARQQIRVGRRIGRDRAPVDAYAAPEVGDMLHAAREKKGVDLYRAERDTKIRARHLAALEAGDFAELPGSVYVKGFLRNYALYLGLDPAEVLGRWHEEQDPIPRSSGGMSVVVPPQPLTDPRSGFTLTPGVVVAAILAVIVIAFAGYVGLQLARFSQVPALTLDGQSVVTVAPSDTSVTITGIAPAGATVDAFDAVQQPAGTTVADAQGHWAMDLRVQKGQNDFTIHTRDPETGRDADPLRMIVNVPVHAVRSEPPDALASDAIGSGTDASTAPSADALASASAPAPRPAALSLATPRQGSRSGDASVRVKGTTDAAEVRIGVRWVGSGKRPGNPGVVEVGATEGSFDHELVLAPGRWEVVVDTVPTDLLTKTTVRRRIRVDYQGFVVVLAARPGGKAWVQVTVDGVELSSGTTLRSGEQTVIQARDTVVFRTRSERRTLVGVKGDTPSQLSGRPGGGTWSITSGEAPVRIQ